MSTKKLVLFQGDCIWVSQQSPSTPWLSLTEMPKQTAACIQFTAEDGDEIHACLIGGENKCPDRLIPTAIRALVRQLLLFEHQFRYCHLCSGKLQRHTSAAMAKQCSSCGEVHYPRIDPCIIVAVSRGDQVLLASPHRLKGELYSVVAGFIEAGETLEQTLHREVEEETGVRIKNLRYFGSQPWAFERNLMIGFTAEWACGEVQHDPQELVDAGWFSFDNLPTIAPQGTIAREMIEYLKKRNAASGKSPKKQKPQQVGP